MRELLGLLSEQDRAWISVASPDGLDAQLQSLESRRRSCSDLMELPLYGIPFAVKDNIDVEGFVTTVACPGFAYSARTSSTVVDKLTAAGAIVIGKTNLDQFATGLVGTRSPYGAVHNPFDPDFISGGSSSGSASVVSRGLVPFSLGTDTAGSGRVPAAFCNIVGFKPTKGAFSTRGVVPACRTLDCVSVFTLTTDDADTLRKLCSDHDSSDPYSRPPPAWTKAPEAGRFAVPDVLEFCGDEQARDAFEQTLGLLKERLDIVVRPIEFAAFRQLASLLYEGPWVSERFTVIRELWRREPNAIDPVVAQVIAPGEHFAATEAFEAEYRRAELARGIHAALAPFDALIVPTTPTIYKIADVVAEPIRTNATLGTYTNFTNLADLCGLALPAAFRRDGLPTGLTLLAPCWRDATLLRIGRRFGDALSLPLGQTGRPYPVRATEGQPIPSRAPSGWVRIAVVGAHMREMPLNHLLTERGGRFLKATKTSEAYKLYALPNTVPPKPGMVRDEKGCAIELEVWELPMATFGEFVEEVPSPLVIGNVELEDGSYVKGFLCESWGLSDARDVSQFGGFRAFLASKP